MCPLLVCMSVNWTPDIMSVCLFQLSNHRTGFNEICLRMKCEILMLVTEYFWYMILCKLVEIYWLFHPEEGGSRFIWNVSKYPQWSKFGPLKFRTLLWLKNLDPIQIPEKKKPTGVTIFLVLLINVGRTLEHTVGILALYFCSYMVMTCHHNACPSFSFYVFSSSVFFNLTFLLVDVHKIAQSVEWLATGWMVLGIESKWGWDFLCLSRLVLSPTQPHIKWVLGLFSRDKVAGAWHCPPTLI